MTAAEPQMSNKPTVRPWQMFEACDEIEITSIPERSAHSPIATLKIGFVRPIESEQRANAALIVRAVNSHEALIDALKWIVKIAYANYEQDEKLRTQGARTLKRIGDHAMDALTQAGETP